MGSPISNLIGEIFLQYFEDKHIKHLLDTKNITFYICYVADILIIYDTKRIQPDLIITNMNQTHKDIKFNATYENNGQTNFLDLLLIRKPTKTEIDIFLKPNTTDTNISFFSNHPIQHETAALRYYITRIHSLPLTPKRKQKEWTIIQYMA